VTLSVSEIALWVCTIGLAVTLPILAFGRVQFARRAADDGTAPPNQNVRPNPVIVRVRRYLLLSGLQLLFDLIVLGFFLLFIFTAEARVLAWPLFAVALGRILVEFPIRATRRRILEILKHGYAQ
jgi:hypothetical protein